MRSRRFLVVLLALAALGSCTRDPGDPAYDNPFDPQGTDPGGGYGIMLEVRGDEVVMSWDNVSGIANYRVYWSDLTPDLEGMEEITSEPVPAPEGTPRVEYVHDTFTPESTNWYRVVGEASFLDENGVQIRASAIPSDPVAFDIDVLAFPSDNRVVTPTRQLQLDLLTGSADSVELSNRADFLASTVFAVQPSEQTQVDWLLPTEVPDASAPGSVRPVEEADRLRVHFRSRTGSSVGPADSFGIQVRFDPRLLVEQGMRIDVGGRFVADTLVVMTIVPVDGQGLERVVREIQPAGQDGWGVVEDLTPASIDDLVEVPLDLQLDRDADHRVKAFLTCDFGFVDSASVDLELPTALGQPSIQIVGGELTTTRDIRVRCVASQAGYVLFSEQPDFSTGTRVAFADTLDYQLEAGLGTRTLYAAFSNPFLAETVVTSTPVTLVSPPAPARR